MATRYRRPPFRACCRSVSRTSRAACAWTARRYICPKAAARCSCGARRPWTRRCGWPHCPTPPHSASAQTGHHCWCPGMRRKTAGPARRQHTTGNAIGMPGPRDGTAWCRAAPPDGRGWVGHPFPRRSAPRWNDTPAPAGVHDRQAVGRHGCPRLPTGNRSGIHCQMAGRQEARHAIGATDWLRRRRCAAMGRRPDPSRCPQRRQRHSVARRYSPARQPRSAGASIARSGAAPPDLTTRHSARGTRRESGNHSIPAPPAAHIGLHRRRSGRTFRPRLSRAGPPYRRGRAAMSRGTRPSARSFVALPMPAHRAARRERRAASPAPRACVPTQPGCPRPASRWRRASIPAAMGPFPATPAGGSRPIVRLPNRGAAGPAAPPRLRTADAPAASCATRRNAARRPGSRRRAGTDTPRSCAGRAETAADPATARLLSIAPTLRRRRGSEWKSRCSPAATVSADTCHRRRRRD